MKRNMLIISVLSGLISIAQAPSIKTANALFELGDYSRAIDIYTKTTPETHYLLLQIAKAHKAKGTYNKALEFYKKAIHKDSQSTITFLEYGKLLMTTKQFVKADSIFSGLVTKHPENPNFHYQLGLVRETRNDSTFIHNYKKAFKIDNSHQKSCFKVAKNFLARREYDSVSKYANIGLSHYADNIELIGLMGQNFYKKERYGKAIPYFLKLLELNYQGEFVYRMLASSYHKEYEYKEAIKYHKILLTYDDEDVKLHNTIAHLYEKIEEYKKAEKHLLISISLQNYTLDTEYFNLSMAYRHQEKWKEAMRYMKKSLRENPNSVKAHYQLAVFADAYYQDPKIKLSYYNKFMDKFGEVDDTPAEVKETISFKKFFEVKVEKRIKQLQEEIAKAGN